MSRIFKPTRKLPDGTVWQSEKYYLEFVDHRGKQVRKPASVDRKESIRLLRESEAKETRVKMGLELPRQVAPTLAELTEPFLRTMKTRLRPRTYKDYERDLRHLLTGTKTQKAWLRGVTRTSDLTPKVIADFQQDALKAGLAPRTANRLFAALSSLVSWALQQGHLTVNPLSGTRLLPKRSKVQTRAFEEEEIDQLLQTSPQDARDAWILFLDTGLRRQELASLTVADIHIFPCKRLKNWKPSSRPRLRAARRLPAEPNLIRL